MKKGQAFWYQCRHLGRRLARTANGRLALVPATAAVGDTVILMAGGKLPLIIKPAKEKSGWTLVGAAYVDGIMQCEAWDEMRCSKIDLV